MTDMKNNPIFIIGAPRSGTTLLRTMLNRHPAIGLCDETYFFYYIHSRQRAFGGLDDLRNREHVVDSYLQTERVKRLGLDLDDLKQTLLEEGTDYNALFLSLLRFYARSQGKSRFGEKTPQHAFEAELLTVLYPDCKLIHLVRDPRDVVASLLRMPWATNDTYANARTWRDIVNAAERCNGQGNYMRVRYENIVENPQVELEHICGFIGEDFDEVMLEAEPGTTADHWWFQRAQGPISRDRLEKWREELSPQQISVIEWTARGTMEQMGYAPVGRKASLLRRASIQTSEPLLDIARRIQNLPRLWYYWIRPTQLAAEESWLDRSN